MGRAECAGIYSEMIFVARKRVGAVLVNSLVLKMGAVREVR
jgi:hypothetical protein